MFGRFQAVNTGARLLTRLADTIHNSAYECVQKVRCLYVCLFFIRAIRKISVVTCTGWGGGSGGGGAGHMQECNNSQYHPVLHYFPSSKYGSGMSMAPGAILRRLQTRAFREPIKVVQPLSLCKSTLSRFLEFNLLSIRHRNY